MKPMNLNIDNSKNNNNLNSKTTYIKLDKKLQDIESWNKPLEFARGKFIVVCEGDDWFESNHLSLAHEVLTKNHEVGMYVVNLISLLIFIYIK